MLAKYGKRFQSGMNCNSGRGNIFVDKRGREIGSNKKEHKETNYKVKNISFVAS